MHKFVVFLSVTVLLGLAGQASAQGSSSFGAVMSGSTGSASSMGSSGRSTATSFYTQTMMGSRPPVPTPLNFNIKSMMPTFPGLQNLMLQRNTFNGPQTTVGVMPSQGTAQPRAQKSFWQGLMN